MLIGHFKYDKRRDTYAGEIHSLTFRTSVTIEPNPNSKSERAPDYRLMADGREIGACQSASKFDP